MIAGANVFRVEGAEVTKLDPAPLDDDVFLSSEYYLDLHGLRPDDVWIVGEGGVVLHWDGKRLEAVHGQFGKSDFFREAAWWSRDEWVTLGNEGVLVRGRLGSSTISREPAPKLKYGHYRTLHTLASGEVLLSSSRDIVVRDAAEPWRRVLPPPDNIEQLAGASRRELWAVLEQSVDRDLKLWFFDGTSWELAPVAADGEDFVPRRMVALPERTLWGLGYRSQVVRVRGTRVDSPIASLRKQHPRDSFEAIAATNDRDVWLAGTAEDKSGLLVHWNGREAKRYAGLGPGGYEVLAVDPRGGVWASGLLGQATVVRDGRPASVDLGFSLNAMVVHPTGAWVGVASHGLIVERPASP